MTRATEQEIEALLRDAAEYWSECLRSDDWKPRRSHIEDARNGFLKAAALAAAQSASQRPIEAEEIAQALYEGEYDRESYPWASENNDQKAYFRDAARTLLSKFAVHALPPPPAAPAKE